MTSLQTASLEEIREVAARICRDYLVGRWKEITADKIIVKRISGGLSNFLYYVSLPEEDNDASNGAAPADGPGTAVTALACTECPQLHDKNSNESESTENGTKNKRQRTYSSCGEYATTSEPREVLLRIYGQAHGEDALEAMITESVVFALLSERNFGPKLHGIFPGGRIEQFIPARALLTNELAHPKISTKIAEKMGEIHSLNIPMSKEPDWLWNCMDRWLKCIGSIMERTDWKENMPKAEVVRAFDYYEESKWFKSIIDSENYLVLFCHNDMQEGNILFRENNADGANASDSSSRAVEPCKITCAEGEVSRNGNNTAATDPDPDLIIIDFEYCAYNYRGFDLANHFLEWTFDYSNPQFPYFHHRKQQYPTEEQRQRFIVRYLQKLNESVADYEPSTEELRGVEKEVRLFSMFSHLFWSLWSVVNVTSNIEFGYWDYAVARIHEYQLLKREYKAEHVMD